MSGFSHSPSSSTPSLPPRGRLWLLERLLARLGRWRAKLLTQPRVLWRHSRRSLAGAALLLSLSGVPVAAAPPAEPLPTEIVVTTTDVTPTDDAECGLVEAVIAANTDTAYFGCAAGSGADTIVLSGNGYGFSDPFGVSSALPPIDSEITIEGNGSTIARTGTTDFFRLIAVNSGGDLTLHNTTIIGGHSSSGGGIMVQNASLALDNCSITANKIGDFYVGGGYGGGLFLDNSILTLTSSVVTGNQNSARYGPQEGGGIALLDSTAVLVDNNITNNYAYGEGGGIVLIDSTAIIVNNTIANNNGGFNGGGISLYESSAVITNTTISHNVTIHAGGGISLDNSDVTLANNTLTGNYANYPGISEGGGLHLGGESSLTLRQSIVSGNQTYFDGSGEVYKSTDSSILADAYNVVGYDGDVRSVGFTPSGSDVIPSGPLSSVLDTSLADNGGPTQTHALVPGSPAIDLVPTGPATDQRGFPRPVDGDGMPSNSEYDAGAFEYDAQPSAIALTTFESGSPSTPLVAALWALLLATLGWLHRR